MRFIHVLTLRTTQLYWWVDGGRSSFQKFSVGLRSGDCVGQLSSTKYFARLMLITGFPKGAVLDLYSFCFMYPNYMILLIGICLLHMDMPTTRNFMFPFVRTPMLINKVLCLPWKIVYLKFVHGCCLTNLCLKTRKQNFL